MCTDLVALISLSSAASDVVLPEPVAPVTRMRPFFSAGIFLKAPGSCSSSMVGILVSNFLSTTEMFPRCEKMLTRKRALPGKKYELSHEPCLTRNSHRRRSLLMRLSAKISVWKGDRLSMAGSTGTPTSSPDVSTCSGRSTVMFRSDTFSCDSSMEPSRSSISDLRIVRPLLVQLVGRRLQQRPELRLVDALVVRLVGADPALREVRHDGVVQRLHAVLLARLDGGGDLHRLALADEVAHARRAHEDLERRAASLLVDALEEVLRHHHLEA